jgi:sugar phosphate isomerase/epimerase
MKIGAMVESFRLDFVSAVKKAADLGLDGIQKYVTGGEIYWTNDQIKETLDIVKSHGLVFSAVCADFGRGFSHPELNDELIGSKTGRIMLQIHDGNNIKVLWKNFNLTTL